MTGRVAIITGGSFKAVSSHVARGTGLPSGGYRAAGVPEPGGAVTGGLSQRRV